MRHMSLKLPFPFFLVRANVNSSSIRTLVPRCSKRGVTHRMVTVKVPESKLAVFLDDHNISLLAGLS